MSLAELARSTPQTRNGLEIQFFGLQRSGNHAVLAWLFQQFDEPVFFFNCVTHFADPITNFRPSRLPNTVPTPRLPPGGIKHLVGGEIPKELEKLREARKDVLVYSYENFVPQKLEATELIADKEATLGSSQRTVRIVLLRDFYNWFASRVRMWENRAQAPANVNANISLWISYAKELLGETCHLRRGVDFVGVCYNKWFTDAEYRKEILDRLVIPHKDTSIRHVPNVGHGSSFDGLDFVNTPEKMQVNARWPYLLQERFADLVATITARQKEIERYNSAIFGPEYSFELGRIIGSQGVP